MGIGQGKKFFTPPTQKIKIEDINNVPDVDLQELDNSSKKLAKESDESYRKVAEKIVEVSTDQLKKQNKSKNELKSSFSLYFKIILVAQLVGLFILLMIRGFSESFILSDTIIITLITSVFVETLGVVAIMVKYSFNSEQEVKILEIINYVIKDYQKFK